HSGVVPRSGSKMGWSSASMKVTETAPSPRSRSSAGSAWSGVMARRSCNQDMGASQAESRGGQAYLTRGGAASGGAHTFQPPARQMRGSCAQHTWQQQVQDRYAGNRQHHQAEQQHAHALLRNHLVHLGTIRDIVQGPWHQAANIQIGQQAQQDQKVDSRYAQPDHDHSCGFPGALCFAEALVFDGRTRLLEMRVAFPCLAMNQGAPSSVQDYVDTEQHKQWKEQYQHDRC